MVFFCSLAHKNVWLKSILGIDQQGNDIIALNHLPIKHENAIALQIKKKLLSIIFDSMGKLTQVIPEVAIRKSQSVHPWSNVKAANLETQ